MERSSLHNFNLPPGLTWGRQRFLRCMNVNPIRAMPAVDDGESTDSEEYNYNDNRSIRKRHAEVKELETPPGGRSSDDPRRKRVRFNLKPLFLEPEPTTEVGPVIRKAVSEVDEDEISVTREKLVMDFQTEVGKLKEAILKNNTPEDEIAPSKDSPPPITETVQNSENQFNMPPPDAGEINAAVDDPNPMSEKKSTRPRRNLEKKEDRAKFAIALSRKEIEDDFVAMMGKKPPRKPKKRPRNVQNPLQSLYPGSRLCEVYPDLYK